jgi:BirA family biotin operon repressor/biotin-[acetyl-CoA-carboxylase] ligase
MDEARALLLAGGSAPFWLMAETQSGGRGRHGRAWASPPGNLHLTLALIDPCAPARGAELGFVAGLALHRAVAAITDLAPPVLALKWPNDLLLGGAKLAGLLLEGTQVHGRFVVLVGFGVNLVAAPRDTPYPAVALIETVKPPPTPAAMQQAIAEAWTREAARWRQEGFAAVRARWLEVAAGLGQPARVRLANGACDGLMSGIDDEGQLVLETAEGERRIDAGDLFFGH